MSSGLHTHNLDTSNPGTSDLLQPGTLKGVVVDSESGEPVGFVYLHLGRLNRTAVTDTDGRFQIGNIPPGEYQLSLHRVGYQERVIGVSIQVTESREELVIRIQRREATGEAVIVTDESAFSGSGIEGPSVKITGVDLRRDLGATLAETLSRQPGIAVRSLGTAPGRPVLRGLGDERLLILQDGQLSADASAFSADHAVTIDPSGSDEIEISRGPAALIYGGNALGGVINVVKNRIATSIPQKIHGKTGFQWNSADRSVSGGGDITLPLRNMAFHADVHGKAASNMHSPEGRIPNTQSGLLRGDAGWSFIQPWGYTGIHIHTSTQNYGIPPDPNSGHPEGVDIEMSQFQVESRSELMLSTGKTPFELLETRLSFIGYQHDEIESGGFIGTSYRLQTLQGSANARTRPLLFFRHGTVGISGETQRYEVSDQGIDSRKTGGALFVIQETGNDRITFQTGARIDVVHQQPAREGTSGILGEITSRTFTGWSGSILFTYRFHPRWQAGFTTMRSFRAPGAEELYSRGPHLAVYSYEIGNPQLEAERGWGNDLFLTYQTDRLNWKGSLFYNTFNNYIYPRDTGQQSIPNPNIDLYQHTGSPARIYGAEAQITADITRTFEIAVSGTLTEGNRSLSNEEQEIRGLTNREEPLPLIPPAKIQAEVTYHHQNIRSALIFTRVFSQTRLAEFETRTDAYNRLEASLQYRFSDKGKKLHTISLQGKNLTNAAYRNHLSRIKEIYSEPGIHVRLLYQLFF